MRRSGRGFTLIELMMVVAILGALTAMAAPLLNNAIRHRNLDQVARMLVKQIYTARSKAILTRSSYILQIQGNYFQVRAQATGQTVVRYPVDPSETLDPSVTVLPIDHIIFNYSGALLDGNHHPSSNAAFTLSDSVTGEVLTVNVAFSGTATITRTDN